MLRAYTKVPQMPNKLFDPSAQSAKSFGTILKKDNSQKLHHDIFMYWQELKQSLMYLYLFTII